MVVVEEEKKVLQVLREVQELAQILILHRNVVVVQSAHLLM
jgi:hypothetical protein